MEVEEGAGAGARTDLSEVLNGVDVVVGWGRDEAHRGHRVAKTRELRGHLEAGQLTALAGLGALGHLDLQHLRVREVRAVHTETRRGHLQQW